MATYIFTMYEVNPETKALTKLDSKNYRIRPCSSRLYLKLWWRQKDKEQLHGVLHLYDKKQNSHHVVETVYI